MQKKLVAYYTDHNVTIKCCLALFFLLSRILASFFEVKFIYYFKPNHPIANLLWIN